MIEAMKQALEALEMCECGAYDKATIKVVRQAIATEESSATQERCSGCEACIDSACGRDECPKGWAKAQPKAKPKRELTDDEIYKVIDQTENAVGYAHNAWDMADQIELVRAILKAAYGIKGEA